MSSGPARSGVRFLLALLLLAGGTGRAPAQADELTALLDRVESAVARGDQQALLALGTLSGDDPAVRPFLDRWVVDSTTRATLRERDRGQPAADGTVRLVVEVLVEAGIQGRLATWQLDVRRGPAGWQITGVATLSVVEGLFRLSIDPSTMYRAKDLAVTAEDLELRLEEGVVFLGAVASGPTVAILLGRGEMTFSPAPETERRQIALLTGGPTLRQRFDAAMVRLSPLDAGSRLPASQLTAAPVDPRQLVRARQVFDEEVGKSFSVDLADLSRETWSLLPGAGDLLAEVRTRRYGTLTYTHDGSDPEDISLFDRARRRNLSIYASKGKLASQGPFFNEDEGAEVDVLDYNVETSYVPDRFWLEGRTRLRIRIRAFALSALTIRLADPLVVHSVISDRHGRLLHVRVRNQNSVIVNLPEPASRDDELTLTVTYAGRHEPQGVERENVTVTPQAVTEVAIASPEPHFLYSNRSYWYAQAPQSDYATATIRFSVPTAFGAVCSGEPAEGSPVVVRGSGDAPARKLHVFVARLPVRYLTCVVSRFGATDVREPSPGSAELPLRATATARQRARGREVMAKAAEMMTFYTGLIGEAPYPSLSLAVLESQIPGGHAPGYVAIINQPLPTSPFTWRDDPAAFDDFPDFFLAHELAHQWWGQAVGWQNYHEQWLSEGFSQYFAALFAERDRGREVFEDVLRKCTRWTMSESDQGPVYLGYRLGHLRGEGRIFRALVYNKGGTVLHMLRRLLGDDVFFAGMRRFYREHKFQKAGTEAFRLALEAEAGRPLETFFNGWIYGQDLPSLSVAWQASDGAARVRIDLQQGDGPVFEFPVTVTRVYRDGTQESETVAIAQATTTLERPLKGALRAVEVNRDRITPVEVKR